MVYLPDVRQSSELNFQHWIPIMVSSVIRFSLIRYYLNREHLQGVCDVV